MRHYIAHAHIHAPAEKIWDILVDGESYPEWDPNMDRAEGEIKLGEKVSFFTKQSPDRAFPAKVTEFIPHEKIVLTGGMPLGLFKSERVHSLNRSGDGGIDFTTEETFSGLLLPLFGGSIPDLTEIFEQFAQGLRTRAEAG